MYHGREEEEKEKNKNLFAKRRPKDYQIFFLGGGDHGRPIQCTGYIK